MNEELRHLAFAFGYANGLSDADAYAVITATGVGVREEEWD